ncbi:putative WEB family protein At1g65010, chloroplastic [Haliotis rufescens]|uniref:putative WEB family protein At1g65010, chloroplastic n=1 Tax=Haliotis rufescens TaxID=6454 RepID=UPI00201EED92|nr:putative WEB family protein At1g65010, chloroplastic [Haliotis rufescens]
MAKMATMRGRMKYEDELCIHKHMLDIEREIEAKELTGPLFSRKLIDMDDMESIEAGRTRPERARRLLNILVLRGPTSFQGLIESLEVMGYNELAKLLKSSCASEKEVMSLLTDSERATDLNDEMSILKERVQEVERTGANKEDLRDLRSDVTHELQSVRVTLKKIEELSRVSRETVGTINNLQQKLDEKEQLLAEAKKQIEELQAKVGNLEAENAVLKSSIKDQQQQLVILKKEMKTDKKEMENRISDIEAVRERDKQETQAQFYKMQQEQQAKTDELMAAFQTLTHTQPEIKRSTKKTGRLKSLLKVKPIVPKNRFQDDRK